MRDRASPQKLGPPWAAFFLWAARANYRTSAAYWSDVQLLVHARLVSALGQKRTSEHDQIVSALPPKADVAERDWHVRFVPKADITTSLDHFVGELLHLRRHIESERFRGLEVDDQFELRDLLHRQIGRLFSLEYLSGIHTDKSICIRYIGAITDQPAGSRKLAILVDRRNGVLERQCRELLATSGKESIGSTPACSCFKPLKAASISFAEPARITCSRS